MSKEQLTAIHKHLTSALGTVQVMLDQTEPSEPPAEEPPAEPPAEEPPTEEPPAEEPPTPPPATPKPPATNDDLVDGLGTGATPCGASGGNDVAQCTDPGVIVSATEVRITQPLPAFGDWDIGTRRLVFAARVGRVHGIYSLGGISGSMPLIQCRPGCGFDLMEYCSFLDTGGSMVLRQDPTGIAGEITRCDFRGMNQDALKVGGSNLIHENRIADAVYRGGAPHSDALTVMSAEGDVIFGNNYVDWNYANRADQSGINNWFRIEGYPAYSMRFGNVILEGNALRHANSRSMGMQVVNRTGTVWTGSIAVRNNRMQKAGGLHKILYGPSSHITDWSGNTGFDGSVIDYSVT